MVVTVVGAVTASLWMPIVAPGFVSKGLIPDTVALTRVMMPYLVIVTVTAVLGAVLKAFDRFAAPSYASIMFSLGIIGGALLYPTFGLLSLGYGLLAGGLGQLLVHIAAYRRGPGRANDVAWRPEIHWNDVGMRRVRSTAPKVGLDVVISKVGSLVDIALVSMLVTGAASILYFAMLLFQLPFALISQSINTVALKELSEAQANASKEQARRLITEGIGWTIFLLLPTSAFMIVMAEPIVDLLLRYGRFDAQGAASVALALQCYSIGLVGCGLQALTGRFFAARNEVRIGDDAELRFRRPQHRAIARSRRRRIRVCGNRPRNSRRLSCCRRGSPRDSRAQPDARRHHQRLHRGATSRRSRSRRDDGGPRSWRGSRGKR